MKSITFDELAQRVKDRSIATVVATFPDLYGRLVGKRFEAHSYLAKFSRHWEACDYLLACDIENEPMPGFRHFSWAHGYGDFAVRPDPATLVVPPWTPRRALVLGDVIGRDDLPSTIAPRQILRRQVARARERGIVLRVASELEFYLFTDSYERVREVGYADARTVSPFIEDYHTLRLGVADVLLDDMVPQLNDIGLDVTAIKGEWGPGQREVNLNHAEPLAMADRHCVLKHAVKELAAIAGMSLTFMAKPHSERAGSSCHLHSSIWNVDGQPLGWNAAAPGSPSRALQGWIAGQVALAPALSVFNAPLVNSYRRYRCGSFAPTRLVVGRDNRTCAFRLIGGTPESIRLENRIPGADVNPYLAIAGLIASGLHGLDADLDIGPDFSGNAYESSVAPELPSSLIEAAVALSDSEPLREAFGSDVVDHYANAAVQEYRAHQRRVSDVDQARYFERA